MTLWGRWFRDKERRKDEAKEKRRILEVVNPVSETLILKLQKPIPNGFVVSSPFGVIREIRGKTSVHNGIDFACPIGTEVRAMADGFIFREGYENPDNPDQGFGLRIWQKAVIDGVEYFFWYGHLSETFVQTADDVKAGDKIGLTGNTGRSTGSHLHVQARAVNTGTFFDMEFV